MMGNTVNVANLQANLSLNTSGFTQGVSSATVATESLTGAILKADLVKGVLQGVADFAGKVTDLIKESVGNFAQYEQLVDGVETLFGDSADAVLNYAENAFKTAGLNANEYMNTVTSFSASLLKGLGGDTKKAADYADRAISDMSDNVNKMGSNMTDVQNAYKGFAKQNYTMLDNLKLGYGGTKTEMEKLIKDAAKLTDVQKELGVTVDANSMSFDNIINAISVIQKQMKITGTTSEEAATTIEGSHRMMKASWDDLLTSMVTGGEWFDNSIDNFIYSTKTYVKNLLPAIEGAMHGFSALINSLAPMLAEELPGFVAEILPDFISAVSDIISGLMQAMPGLLTALNGVIPMATDSLTDLVPNLIDFILESLPLAIDAGITLLTSLINGFANNIETIVPQMTTGVLDMISKIEEIISNKGSNMAAAGVTFLSKFTQAIVDAVPQALTDLTDFINKLTDSLHTAAESDSNPLGYGKTALLIVKNLAEHLATEVGEILPELTSAASAFITEFVSQAGSVTVDVAEAAFSIIKKLANGIAPAIPQVLTDITTAAMSIVQEIVNIITKTDISDFLDAAVTIVTSLADGVVSSVEEITKKLPELITKIVAWLTDPSNLTEMASAALAIFGEIVSDIPAILASLITGLTEIITGIANHFRNNGDEMVGGIGDGLAKLKDQAVTIWTDKIKPAFEEFGKYIKEYFEQFEWVRTVEAFLENLRKKIEELWDKVKDAFTGVGGFFGKVKDWIGEIDVTPAVRVFVEGIKSDISGAWDIIKDVFTGVDGFFGKLTSWFSEIDVTQIVTDFVNRIGAGVRGLWNKVKSWFGGNQEEQQSSELELEEDESIEMPAGMLTLDYNNLQPIPEDVIESYQRFADAVKMINTAIAGGGEEASLEGAGTEEAGGNLTDALKKIPELMNSILAAAQALAEYFIGDFLNSVNTLIAILCVIETNEDGTTNANGGNTLYNSLGAVLSVFESIYSISQNIANFWTGPFREAVNQLKQICAQAEGFLSSLADKARDAAAAFNELASAIMAVCSALEALSGMSVNIPSPGGFGGGLASGGFAEAGTTYLVGENGPELFSPHRNGWITSTDDLMDSGERVINIYNNFAGEVIGDEQTLSEFVTAATNKAIEEAVYAGI